MAASTFTACSDKTDETDGTEGVQTDAESTSGDESAAEEEEEGTTYYKDMAAVDYEGWTMRIAGRPLNTSCFNVITVEDITGDVFNDAIFNREAAVQDKYNIEIEEIIEDDPNGCIKKSVTANTQDYSMSYCVLTDEISMFCNNYAIGVSDMPVFDLTKPYWDQGAIRTLSINGKMYYGLSDMGFGHYESNLVMFYNGVLLTNTQLESPYDLYKNGEWTLDKMYEMMQTVSNDENGDGRMVEGEDIFGFVGRVGKYQTTVTGSGYSLVMWDDSTKTSEFKITSDDMMAIGEMTKKMLFDEDISIVEGDKSTEMFKQGQALFYCRTLGDFRNLRDQEDDYGIINWPALRGDMVGSSYCVNPEAFFISADCEDQERLATIIESINAYTYDYVLDDYIEKAVIGKGARDKQSAEIVRENFSRRAFDMAGAFGLSSPQGAWKTAIMKDMYASVESKSNKTVQREMEAVLSGLMD